MPPASALDDATFNPSRLFDVSRNRVKVAAQAVLPKSIPSRRLSPRAARRLDRASQLLLVAADEAWEWKSQLNGTKWNCQWFLERPAAA